MKENEISSSRIYKLNQEGKERLTRPVGTAAAALLLPGKFGHIGGGGYRRAHDGKANDSST
jgi:hypothetical protein